MIRQIARILVGLLLGVFSTMHYQNGEWWLLAGDFLLAIVIGANWLYAFIVAKAKTNKSPPA